MKQILTILLILMFYGCDMFNKPICVIAQFGKEDWVNCYNNISENMCIEYRHQGNSSVDGTLWDKILVYNTEYKDCEDYCSSKFSWWTKEKQGEIEGLTGTYAGKQCIIK